MLQSAYNWGWGEKERGAGLNQLDVGNKNLKFIRHKNKEQDHTVYINNRNYSRFKFSFHKLF